MAIEWRIIVPVLCLIGFLIVPGYSVDSNPTNGTINGTVSYSTNGTNNNSTNGTNNNSTNGTSNNPTNGTSNIPTNGTNNNSTNGTSNNPTNGTSNNPTNGTSNNPTNGTSNNPTNGTSNNPTNGTSNNPTNGTSSNSTANSNQTTVTAATTVATPVKVTTVNLVFKILQDYKPAYANLSDPETITLINSITNTFTPFYKKRYGSIFRQIRIQKLSQGSVIADTVVEFDNTNNTSPNVTDVKNTLTDAVANGNISLTVDTASINATDITNATQAATTVAATVPVTTVSSTVVYKVNITINSTFTSDLANISSPAAVTLAKNISDQFDVVLKKLYTSYLRTRILQFRSGSTIAGSELDFNPGSSNPTVADLAKNIKNAQFSFPLQSVSVQDQSGNTANSSPVLASMLTALWMTLASLLVSAVMH